MKLFSNIFVFFVILLLISSISCGKRKPRVKAQIGLKHDPDTSAQNNIPQVLPVPTQTPTSPGPGLIAFTLNPGNPSTGEAPSFQIYPSTTASIQPINDDVNYDEIDEDLENEFPDVQSIVRSFYPYIQSQLQLAPQQYPSQNQRPQLQPQYITQNRPAIQPPPPPVQSQVFTPTIGRDPQGMFGYQIFIPFSAFSGNRPNPGIAQPRRYLPDYQNQNQDQNQFQILPYPYPYPSRPQPQPQPFPGVSPQVYNQYLQQQPQQPYQQPYQPQNRPQNFQYQGQRPSSGPIYFAPATSYLAQPQTRASVRVLPSFDFNSRILQPKLLQPNQNVRVLPIADVFPIAQVLPGGLGNELSPDNTVKGIVQDLMGEITSAISSKSKTPLSDLNSYEVMSYRTQAVAGTNYYLKIKLSADNMIWHVKVYKNLEGKAHVIGVDGPKMSSDKLEFFE